MSRTQTTVVREAFGRLKANGPTATPAVSLPMTAGPRYYVIDENQLADVRFTVAGLFDIDGRRYDTAGANTAAAPDAHRVALWMIETTDSRTPWEPFDEHSSQTMALNRARYEICCCATARALPMWLSMARY
ncbi:hypothetical protein GCM10027063_40030 [Promicromonospora xylanilytica]